MGRLTSPWRLCAVVLGIVGCKGSANGALTAAPGDPQPQSESSAPARSDAAALPAGAVSTTQGATSGASTLRLGSLAPGVDLTFAAKHRGALCVAFVPPDGRRALSSGVEDVAILWDTRTGQPIRRFEGKTFRFGVVALTRDGKRALTDGDAGATFWELDTGKILKTLAGPRFGFSAVAMSPDEQGAATFGADGLTFWDLEAAAPIRTIAATDALSIRYSPDGLRAVWMGDDEKLCEVGIRGSDAPKCVVLDVAPLDGADLKSDELLVGDRTGQLSLWATGTGRELKRWTAHAQRIDAAVLLPERSLAASSGGTPNEPSKGLDDTLRIWDTTQAALLFERPIRGITAAIDIAPDGARVLYGVENGEVHLWTLPAAR